MPFRSTGLAGHWLAAAGVALFVTLLPTPSVAQSSVSLYGLVDLSAGSFQDAGGLRQKRLDNGNLSTSYFGLGGTEDLGGGLAASFALESFLRADSGRAGRVAVDASPRSDVFFARAANVSLKSPAGTVTLGRSTTTLFISTLIFNPFVDSFGYSPAIRQYYISSLLGDSGWSNSIKYQSPSFSGLSGTLHVSAGEGAPKSVGSNIGGHLLYFGGPIAATAAWQRVKSDTDFRFSTTLPPGFKDQAAWQLGASYDLKVAKLFGQIGRVTTDATVDTTVKIAQLGASAPLGGGSLLASWGRATFTGGRTGTSSTVSLGYDYFLSKRTDVYAIVVNDRFTALSTGNSFSVGVKHKF